MSTIVVGWLELVLCEALLGGIKYLKSNFNLFYKHYSAFFSVARKSIVNSVLTEYFLAGYHYPGRFDILPGLTWHPQLRETWQSFWTAEFDSLR
jgi:hypothetical protein